MYMGAYVRAAQVNIQAPVYTMFSLKWRSMSPYSVSSSSELRNKAREHMLTIKMGIEA